MRADRWMGGTAVVLGLGGLVLLLGTVFRGSIPETRSGHVVAVDPAQGVLVLAVMQPGGHGESLSLRVLPAARIQRFDEMLKIADLAPGQLVDVTTRHTPQGGQEATTVRIRGGAAATDDRSDAAPPPCPREVRR